MRLVPAAIGLHADGGFLPVPSAGPFQAAFGLGDDAARIAQIDADGVALGAVQALERRTAS